MRRAGRGRCNRLPQKPSPAITTMDIIASMESCGAEFFFSDGARGTLRVRNLAAVPQAIQQMFFRASAVELAACIRSRQPEPMREGVEQ